MGTEPSPWLRTGARFACFHCRDRASIRGTCAACGRPRVDLALDPRGRAWVLAQSRRIARETPIAREMHRARWLRVFKVGVHAICVAVGIAAAWRVGRIDTHGYVPKGAVRAVGVLLGYAGARVGLALGMIVAHAVVLVLAAVAWGATALGSLVTRDVRARRRAARTLQLAFARFTGGDAIAHGPTGDFVLRPAALDDRAANDPDDATGTLVAEPDVDVMLGLAGVTGGSYLEDATAPAFELVRDDGTTLRVDPAVAYVRFFSAPVPRVVSGEAVSWADGVARRPPGAGLAIAPSGVVDTWGATGGDSIALHGGETLDRNGDPVRVGTPTSPLWITVSPGAARA